jgi:hypothetical protein
VRELVCIQAGIGAGPILRHDQSGTVDLFRRYSYPDVGRERRPAFSPKIFCSKAEIEFPVQAT